MKKGYLFIAFWILTINCRVPNTDPNMIFRQAEIIEIQLIKAEDININLRILRRLINLLSQ